MADLAKTKNRAFFLDRDGCLIEEENYLSDPGKARLCPGAAEALKKIRYAGYKIVMTSNQSGIARGYFTMKEVLLVEKKICELLKNEGSPVPDGWYYCPHHPKGTVSGFAVECSCRKPAPGLLLKAAEELNLDTAYSAMIGDKASDLEAGFAAGCPWGALVRTGHGMEQKELSLSGKFIVKENILQAAEELLKILEA